MNENFREFLRLLIERKVEYLLVGGFVVGFYGYPRYTGDLDIWISLTIENRDKIIKVLKDFGFESLGLTAMDFEKKGTIVQLGFPPNRIDIINDLDELQFDKCFTRKKIIEYENLKISCISLEDLIKNKKAVGRLKDQLDLENLIKK